MRGGRRDPRLLGLAGAIVIAALVYLTFAQRLPFTHRYQVTAIVKSSNGLRKNSPVRIAGVDVGKVDAGDAHRRVLAQPVGGLDDRRDLVAVRERQALGERQVDERGDDDRAGEAEQPRVAPASP